MRQFLAVVYMVLCVWNLVYELTSLPFDSGIEAVLVMGTTCIGLYLAWFASSAILVKGTR